MNTKLDNNSFSKKFDVSIVISAAREHIDTLRETLRSCTMACQGLTSKFHLLINGNLQLAKDAVELVNTEFAEHEITTWHFALADKANCWNTYCHSIKEPSYLHFFIDGYVRPNPDSIKVCLDYFQKYQPAAITGVPSFGRSAKKLREEMVSQGGIHGNLFAMSDESISKVVESGFKLPIGLYRVDSVIGAAINFHFSPEKHSWDSTRIKVLESVSWEIDPQKWYSWKDLKSQVKRMLRQGRGILENRAVKQLFAIEKSPLRLTPKTANKLISENLKAHPFQTCEFIMHPFMYLAYKDVKNESDKSYEELVDRANCFEEITK